MKNTNVLKSFYQKIEYVKENYITKRQYLALKEGFEKLNANGISCFFYKRIGKKDDFQYSDRATDRMNQGISYLKMLEDPDKYEEDLKELYGDKYSKEYVMSLSKITQVVLKGNYYAHEDIKSAYINVLGGYRITVGIPQTYNRTIHIYGRCGVFGYAVEDADNMPSQLQYMLNNVGPEAIRVINHGMWGGSDKKILHNFLHDIQHMKKGDIVIFYQAPLKERWMKEYVKNGLHYEDFTDEFHKAEDAKYCFFDRPGHMNATGYKIVAKLIYNSLEKHNFGNNDGNYVVKKNTCTGNLDAYLSEYIDKKFYKDLNQYIKDVKGQYSIDIVNKKCGAIVMNCNPFTLGHRYLIECAVKQVDILYIFVVEENKSFFEFEDRLEMVRQGTKDLKNVIVVPSGKFMISALTFPEYFMKDYVKEKDFDVSADLDIFGRNIAPAFNISVRFAGEEPLDVVTANYNKYMGVMLPMYGIEFCEIPRLKDNNCRVINATYIRKLLNDGNYGEILKYVPESTYTILQQKYMK